jgi:HSP20 family protein
MSMELWDPFEQALSLRSVMDRLLQESFVRPQTTGSMTRGDQGMMLPLDIHESEDAYTLQASLPGVKPEDVQIQITGDTVTIRGETQEKREEKRGDQVLLRERRAGVFSRTVSLPTPIDADHAEARFENGVLTLTLPKSQQAKPRRISVRAGDGRQSISAQNQSGMMQSGQSGQSGQTGSRNEQAAGQGQRAGSASS